METIQAYHHHPFNRKEKRMKLYYEKLRSARSADAVEGTPEGIVADFWLDSRTAGTNLSDYRWNKYTT